MDSKFNPYMVLLTFEVFTHDLCQYLIILRCLHQFRDIDENFTFCCTQAVICASDSQVELRNVKQVQYICQFVFLTTTTCIHLTDVLRLQSDGTFAGYSSNFCWLEQQYWQFTAATFMNFSCTLDMIRKSTKFLDRILTHTRFY